MKRIYFLKTVAVIIVVLFISGLNSCKKDDVKEEDDAGEYFVSSQSLKIRTKAELGVLYTFLGASYLPAFDLVPQVKTGVSIQKIIYKTDYLSNKINASGLVCLPDEPGEYPILCFQNGTNTLHANAPSKNYNDQLFAVLEGVASMGFIVVIPDYLGFGESEQIDHPYLHTETTVSTILNMIRASKEFSEIENTVAKPNNDLYILGYSQGGWATLSLQKAIEQNYSSEFHLVASACGAGPYNMTALNDYVLSQTEYPMPYFLAYILKGHKSVGSITNAYSDVFNSVYASKIDQYFDGKHSGDEINAVLNTTISQLIAPGYLSGYKTDSKYASIRSAFEKNSVAAWNVSTPTRLIHADLDVYVPISISEKMVADFRAIGVSETKLNMVTINGFDHSGGIVPTGVNAVLWFLSFK